MAQVVAATVALAVILLLAVSSSRERRGAWSPDPDRLSYRLPRAWWAVMYACSALFLFALVMAVRGAAAEHVGWDWGVAGWIAFFVPSALLGAHWQAWRMEVDPGGIRVRRLLLPDRDLPWGSLDAVAVDANPRSREFDNLTFASRGRRLLRIQRLYLGGRDAAEGQLFDALERHGVLVAPPRELPPGLRPWGRFGWWWDGLAGWQRDLFVLAVCGGVVFAVFFPIWVLTTFGS